MLGFAAEKFPPGLVLKLAAHRSQNVNRGRGSPSCAHRDSTPVDSQDAGIGCLPHGWCRPVLYNITQKEYYELPDLSLENGIPSFETNGWVKQ